MKNKFIVPFLFCSLLIMPGCIFATKKDLQKTTNTITSVQGNIANIDKNINGISDNQKSIGVQTQNLKNSVLSFQTQISDIKTNVSQSIKNINDLSVKVNQSKTDLQKTTVGIDGSVGVIKDQTGKIKTNVGELPKSQQATNINQSADKIDEHAALILQFNNLNKKTQKSIGQMKQSLDNTNQLLQKTLLSNQNLQQQNAKAQTQILRISALNASNDTLIKDSKKQAEQAKSKAQIARKQSIEDQQKRKELQDQNNKEIRLILKWIIAIGVFLVAGSIASIFAGIFPLKISIAGIVAGLILTSVAGAMLKWWEEMQTAGLIIIIASVVGLIVYVIYHFSMSHKANSQIVQMVDHTKQYLTQQGKKVLFDGEKCVANLAQSSSTQNIVSSIKNKLQKSAIAQKVKQIKNKI